ncbi:MAG TPA: KH domain-containing protein [Bacteroidetes bacterium]|nr:KH domain-containing protein [Bacteroidota bacterium]
MKNFIEFIVKHLVEDPDQVQVTVEENERGLLFKLSVGENDIGRVVGKEGRTARSIRTLLTAAAARQGKRASLEIMDGAREPSD